MDKILYTVVWSEHQPALQAVTPPGHSIYCLHRLHNPHVPAAPLYIGRILGSISHRMIEDEGSSEVFLRSAKITAWHVGRILGEQDPRGIDDPELIGHVEALLIDANRPPYNASTASTPPRNPCDIKFSNSGCCDNIQPDTTEPYHCGFLLGKLDRQT